MNKCWFIVNWTSRKKLLCGKMNMFKTNLGEILIEPQFFIEDNAYENVQNQFAPQNILYQWFLSSVWEQILLYRDAQGHRYYTFALKSMLAWRHMLLSTLVQVMALSSHYINKCWLIVNSTSRKTLPWILCEILIEPQFFFYWRECIWKYQQKVAIL